MTNSNFPNDEYNFDFLINVPVSNEYDSEWLEGLDTELSCQECEYYSDNGILPCAVNPSQVYQPDDCGDYSLSKND